MYYVYFLNKFKLRTWTIASRCQGSNTRRAARWLVTLKVPSQQPAKRWDGGAEFNRGKGTTRAVGAMVLPRPANRVQTLTARYKDWPMSIGPLEPTMP